MRQTLGLLLILKKHITKTLAKTGGFKIFVDANIQLDFTLKREPYIISF